MSNFTKKEIEAINGGFSALEYIVTQVKGWSCGTTWKLALKLERAAKRPAPNMKALLIETVIEVLDGKLTKISDLRCRAEGHILIAAMVAEFAPYLNERAIMLMRSALAAYHGSTERRYSALVA